MTLPTLRIHAPDYTKDDTIPPGCYMTTEDLDHFIDCVRRVTSVFACQYSGPDMTEWRQILSLTNLLYAEVADARLDDLEKNKVSAPMRDYWFSAGFNSSLPMRNLQRAADEDMLDEWKRILDAYYSKEEE